MTSEVTKHFNDVIIPRTSATVLNSLQCAVLVVDRLGSLQFVNYAAEQLFSSSASQLIGSTLNEQLPVDSSLSALIRQTQKTRSNVSEYTVTLESARIVKQVVDIQVSVLPHPEGSVVVNIFTRKIADTIDRQLAHRNAARTVTAMAAMLAHEIKNPLSGIRGAAQLLEQDSRPEDWKLTQLICDETDRICALVDRMEVFSEQDPLERVPVNIHQVLERVRDVSKTGFAKSKKITEIYDPSLPMVYGNFDQLVQVFLNLLKNAAEAAPVFGGEISILTSYKHGVRLAIPGSSSRTQLPLVITLQDNGPGIPENLRDNIFDAFVTSKPKGSGLGLALVAKIVDAHGGVIEVDSQPGQTLFRVMLPEVPNEAVSK